MRYVYALPALCLAVLAACSTQQGGGTAKEPAKEANITLSGAGASVPFPLFS
jgi:hypothetical protein